MESDPIVRLRRFLDRESMWDDQKEEALAGEVSKRVDEDVAALEALPKADPTDMLDYMYESLPLNLAEQRQALAEEVNR